MSETPTPETQEAKQFVDRRTSNASAVMNPTIEPMDWIRAARILRNEGMELEERLAEARERIAELEAALKPLVAMNDQMNDPDYGDGGTYAGAYYTYHKGQHKEWTAARAALAKTNPADQ